VALHPLFDGCRFALAMGRLSKDCLTYKKLKLENKENVVCMAIPKNNYGAFKYWLLLL